MSMKRTKKATGAKASSSEFMGFTPPPAIPKWEEVTADKPDDGYVDYAPSRTFKHGDLVTHSKFGKGFVVSVEMGRAEILFADGVKKLAHAAS